MFFKCKNCGGNVIYSPEKHGMYCPFCESEKSGERAEGDNRGELGICPNCGGEVKVEAHTSATQCPYCDSYLIFNERVEGAYEPKLIIPFQLGREVCKKSIRDKFKHSLFAPTDFLSEARLNSMQGIYVPFWFYDYDTNCVFKGEGTKVRRWRSGDKEYTEISYYAVNRNMDIRFENIPADASVEMPDEVMDLVAPFQYGQLEGFAPEYMSGFYAEKYNMPAEMIEERAKTRMNEDAVRLMKESCAGYSSMRATVQNVNVKNRKVRYGLLPIWRYIYRYKDKDYPFYVNGQTGKIVGEAPLSGKKMWIYTGTLWGCLTLTLLLGFLLLNLFATLQ